MKADCLALARFLDALGNFDIEELNHVNIIFSSPEPLIVILKKSPRLKLINLRYNSSDFILEHIRKYCINLETLILHDYFGMLMASSDGLFETFYKGHKKEVVMQKLAPGEPVDISFPNLKRLDLGKSKLAYSLYETLPYFYPKLESLSCNSNNFYLDSLRCPPPKIKREEAPFHIVDITISHYNLSHTDSIEIQARFPNLKHITLDLVLPADGYFNEVEIAKLDDILTNCSFSSLTLAIPLNSLRDVLIDEILTPLLKKIESKIKIFQLHFSRDFLPHIYFLMFSNFNHLKSFSLKLDQGVGFRPHRENLIFKSKPTITSLAFFSDHGWYSEAFSVVCCKFVACCPNVSALEIIAERFPMLFFNHLPTLAPHVRDGVHTLSLFLTEGLRSELLEMYDIVETFNCLRKVIFLNCATFYKRSMNFGWRVSGHDVHFSHINHSLITFVGFGSRKFQNIIL